MKYARSLPHFTRKKSRPMACRPAHGCFRGLPFTALLLTVLVFNAPMAVPSDAITDSRIEDEVREDLLMDQLVSAHLIDVEVDDGIVELSGSVSNLLEKQRAVRIAEQLKGVRAVVNRIDVRPVVQTDGHIQRDVVSALTMDPAVDAHEIAISVDTGVVMLTGTVDSWAEKRLAARITRGIKGVTEIQNNTVVDFKEDRPAREIRVEIERRLELDPRINAALVDVEIEDGTVRLSGSVGSAADKNAAYVAARLTGVEQVDTEQLEVNWLVRGELERERRVVFKSDDQIKEAVALALAHDPRTNQYAIDVAVENGVVTLTGTVQTLSARRAAVRDAQNTVGIMRVDDRLDVRITARENETIEQDLERAFLWDPVLERHEITPVVRNGKAYLYGRVDNAYEKWRAGDVASRVPGLAAVANRLEIADEWARRGDSEIEQAVEDELFWSAKVDEDGIAVEVESGIVTLTGDVESWTEHHAAIDEAFDAGARVVRSELSVAGDDGATQTYWYNQFHYRFPDRVYF